MPKTWNAPDVKAPRFRYKTYTGFNDEFIKELKSEYPQFKGMSEPKIRSVVKVFNRLLKERIISYRDGVELPANLGRLYLGTCPAKRTPNIDRGASAKAGHVVEFLNWNTDNKIVKLFYERPQKRHHFKHWGIWYFKATKAFKKQISEAYKKNWQYYRIVDDKERIYRELRRKRYMLQLMDYNKYE